MINQVALRENEPTMEAYEFGEGDVEDAEIELQQFEEKTHHPDLYDDLYDPEDDDYLVGEVEVRAGVEYDRLRPDRTDGDFFNPYCDRAEVNTVDPAQEQMLPPDWRPRYRGNRRYSAGETRYVFQLGPDNLALLDYFFELFTGDQKVCDKEQLARILRAMGMNPTYDDIQSYVDGYSKSPITPSFTFANACDIIRSRMQDTDEKVLIHELTDSLRIFDDSREGYIPKDMLHKNMMKIPQPPLVTNTAAFIDELVRTMDDGNSLVSYERFVTDLIQYSKKYMEYCKKKLAQQAPPITTDPKVVLEVLNDQRRFHQHMQAWSLMKQNMEKVKSARAKRNLKKQQSKKAAREAALRAEELERQRKEEEERKKQAEAFEDDE